MGFDRPNMILKVDKIDRETDKAIGVKDTQGEMQWFPKSQVTIEKNSGGCWIIVPAWLADTKDNLEFEEE